MKWSANNSGTVNTTKKIAKMVAADDAKERKHEWVGLATGEARKFYESDLSREELIHKIDEFLQEKNT